MRPHSIPGLAGKLVGRDLIGPSPEPPILDGGKTPMARTAASSASASPERRQDAALHWVTVPQRGNDGYPNPANRPARCRKRIVNSGEAVL